MRPLQERELKEILELSYKSSAYYKEAFDAAGVKPSDFQKLSDISKFPFVNKQIERERQTKSPLLGEHDYCKWKMKWFCFCFKRVYWGSNFKSFYKTGF